jgi:MFS family permease
LSANIDTAAPAAEPELSRWGAFSQPAFTVIWLASIVSNVGLAMFDTGSGWLMTSLNATPMAVSMVQVVTTLPMFLFTLPAGALADIIDPRRLLILVEIVVTIFAGIFAAAVSLHLATPAALLLTAFLLGAGGALTAPAWSSITPLMVPREELDNATAANSVGYNLSRAIGPAIGGAIIALSGIASPFWAFTASNVVIIAALLWWRPKPKCSQGLPAERLTSAVKTGLRYAANNHHLRATLMRAIAFFPFASAYWALLPLIARHQMQHGPEVFGFLLGAIGLGAIIGSLTLGWLKTAFGPDGLGAVGTIATALALVLFGLAREEALAYCAAMIAGASWTIVLATLYVSAQIALPDWVRGRGLAVFLTVYFGAMTVGSALWGHIAGMESLPVALFIAAAGAVIAIPLTWRWKLQTAAGLDLTPSMHWRAPAFKLKVENDQGPVLVTVEYRIEVKDRFAFLAAIEEMGYERRRDGAFAWGVFEDPTDPDRFVETFLIESWLELRHLRERVTNADRLLEEEVRKHLLEPPKVSFLVATDRPRRARKQRTPELDAPPLATAAE